MASLLKASLAALSLLRAVDAVPMPQEEGVPSSTDETPYPLFGNSFGGPGNRTYDYVVVGAGNAGAPMAYRLAEGGYSVALVEAGGFYEVGNSNITQLPADGVFFAGKDPEDTNNLIDWNFVTEPQAGMNNARNHYARGKTLGGNTARNYMTYQISTESGYQMWGDMIDDQSYSYENFLPYFLKHQRFTPPRNDLRFANSTPTWDDTTVGTEGLVSVGFHNYAGAFASWAANAWRELGMSEIPGFNSGQLLGFSYILATVNHELQERETSKTAYLEPAWEDLPTLTTYTNTLAKRILFNGTTATGVYVDRAGQEFVLSARHEVIVSAGSFQSPQLLMVSGIGPAETLQEHGIEVIADLPGVGQNMQDHVIFGPAYRMNFITSSSLTTNPSFAAQAWEEYNSDPRTGYLTNAGCDLIAWEKVPEPLRGNLSSQARSDLSQFPHDWPELEHLHVGGYFGYQRFFTRDAPQDGYNYATAAVAINAPLSRGNVTIASADTADLPLVNPNLLGHPTDVEVAVAGFRRARESMATEAMRGAVIGEEYFPGLEVQTDEQIAEWLREASNTVFHAACTCAMGRPDDPMAVLDSQARVYGVEGVRVVDASSMPVLVPGHPMSTIYALAEKIADGILRENPHNGTARRWE